MNLLHKVSLEPKLTLDGLMTLVAGIIPFVAIMLQIKSSHNGLERQLRDEKEAIIASTSASLDRVDTETCLPPQLSAPGPDFFAVYRGNAGRLGAFEYVLVEKVVQFYGLAELLLTSIREYTRSLAGVGQGPVLPGSAPRKLLHQIQKVMYSTDNAGIEALKELRKIAHVSFESLKLAS